jgi:hypothetical protein
VAALEVVNLISGHLEKQKYAEKNWPQSLPPFWNRESVDYFCKVYLRRAISIQI